MNAYQTKHLRLIKAVEQSEQSFRRAVREASRRGQQAPVRHKCFIAYHRADIDAVTMFVDTFADVFIPRVIGVSDSDLFKDPVNSEDEAYIKAQIGAKYLSDSSVTILFAGRCAWSRRYIDWELSSTMRDDPVNGRSGLMAITPSDKSVNKLPARFSDNYVHNAASYAKFYYFPTSESALRTEIEDAFQARTTRAELINNTRALARLDVPC